MRFTKPHPSLAVDVIERHAAPLPRSADHDRALIDLLAGARFALLGEASHGSDDFYRERAAITRRLIVERGLDAVAVEADWPDAYRVNRYVRGLGDDANGTEALSDFKRQLAVATRAAGRAEAAGSRSLLARARLERGQALRKLGRPALCSRSQSMNSRTTLLRHIQAGNRLKSESASVPFASSPRPRT